jgi:hypothetical protein
MAALVMGLLLSWVWKSNQVTDYSQRLKKLETRRDDLKSENTRLSAELADLKSLSRIHVVVTREYGLTQNVAQRIFLADPVTPKKKHGRLEFASETGILDWLETTMAGSNVTRADSPKPNRKSAEQRPERID